MEEGVTIEKARRSLAVIMARLERISRKVGGSPSPKVLSCYNGSNPGEDARLGSHRGFV